jgi:hypothetical protein
MQNTNQPAVGGRNALSVELKVWFGVKLSPVVTVSSVTTVTREIATTATTAYSAT